MELLTTHAAFLPTWMINVWNQMWEQNGSFENQMQTGSRYLIIGREETEWDLCKSTLLKINTFQKLFNRTVLLSFFPLSMLHDFSHSQISLPPPATLLLVTDGETAAAILRNSSRLCAVISSRMAQTVTISRLPLRRNLGSEHG